MLTWLRIYYSLVAFFLLLFSPLLEASRARIGFLEVLLFIVSVDVERIEGTIFDTLMKIKRQNRNEKRGEILINQSLFILF